MIDFRNFRKFIFVNSQSCTYCIDKNDTVFAGILRNMGYKYAGRQSDEIIQKVEEKYRRVLTILNIIFVIELVLYVYLFVFPLYTLLFKLPFFVAILILTIIPMAALYVTYLFFNNKYEAFLSKDIGVYQVVQFKPNVYNVEPKAYERYIKTPRKSAYGALLIILMFIFYAFTPICIDYLNANQKYNFVVKISKIYLKLIPINSDVYAQCAYANYMLGNYKAAISDYEMANKYSFSNSFDFEILGSNTYLLSKDEMLTKFDEYINSEEDESIKDFIKSQKALYLQQNNEYSKALEIYNELVNAYETEKRDSFEADLIYFNRGVVKSAMGDNTGAAIDKRKARTMCSDCSFEVKLTLVQRP